MTAAQKEDLRHAVLEFLATRHPAAFQARAIRRTVATELDFPVAESEVAETCEFLAGLDRVRIQVDSLGSTKYYNATSNGVLAFERGPA